MKPLKSSLPGLLALLLLLLKCGDVETNPGPPRRAPAPAPKKAPEPTKEEQSNMLAERVRETIATLKTSCLDSQTLTSHARFT